jgi:hypothetical protein
MTADPDGPARLSLAIRAARLGASVLLVVVQPGPEGIAVRAAVQNWLPGGSAMTGEPGAKGAPRPSTDGRAQGQDALGLSERERDYLLLVRAAR